LLASLVDEQQLGNERVNWVWEEEGSYAKSVLIFFRRVGCDIGTRASWRDLLLPLTTPTAMRIYPFARAAVFLIRASAWA
jgi:hypothetical protein